MEDLYYQIDESIVMSVLLLGFLVMTFMPLMDLMYDIFGALFLGSIVGLLFLISRTLNSIVSNARIKCDNIENSLSRLLDERSLPGDPEAATASIYEDDVTVNLEFSYPIHGSDDGDFDFMFEHQYRDPQVLFDKIEEVCQDLS